METNALSGYHMDEKDSTSLGDRPGRRPCGVHVRGMMETEDWWSHEGVLGLRGDRGVQSHCERLFPLYREELEASMWACGRRRAC